jgi:hypothetical protein
MPGYIYLVRMADAVYKVGRTFQEYGPNLKRFKAYPRDATVVMVLEVQDYVAVEHEVLRRCLRAFGGHLRGREFFVGPESEFINIIFQCMNVTASEIKREVPKPPPASDAELVVYRYIDGVKQPIEVLKISKEDQSSVSEYTWFKDPNTLRIYATIEGRRVFLKEVLTGEGGTWIHLNGDPLDYTRANLVKTNSNVRTIKRTEGSSKHVGVCYVPGRKKPWKATLSGKLIGYFATEDEAVQSRNDRFAKIPPPNFP